MAKEAQVHPFPAEKSERSPDQDPPGRILIVEDDEDIREAFREALDFEGYQVEAVSNGREALERIRASGAPDLIFLDMMMPIMNGWQFLELRMTDPLLTAIPIVVVSAAGEKAKMENIAGFIRKPADLDDVFSHANRYCKPRKSA